MNYVLIGISPFTNSPSPFPYASPILFPRSLSAGVTYNHFIQNEDIRASLPLFCLYLHIKISHFSYSAHEDFTCDMLITVISELWRYSLYCPSIVFPDTEQNVTETRQWTLESTGSNYTEHQLMQQFTSVQYVLRFCTNWFSQYPGIMHVFVGFSSSLFSADTKVLLTDDLNYLPLTQTSLNT
jgi:hypothetical protein